MKTTPTAKELSLIAVVFCALFLSLVLRPSLSDPDYYWHIEAGRLISQTFALPDGDPFSFTQEGKHWVLHEWLFEVALYGVFAAFGTAGVKIFAALLSVSALGFVFAAARKLLNRTPAALWLTALVYPFFLISGTPRPQLVTYVLLGAALYILTALKYRGQTRLLPALPLMMVIWVNAHAGYFIGMALIILFTLSLWLEKRISAPSADKAAADAPADAPNVRPLALTAGLCVIASLCNPYFAAHWLYPFQVMGLSAAQMITEWESPNFHSLFGLLYLFLVAAFTALQIYRRKRPGLAEMALSGAFIMAGFFSARHVILAAMMMAVMAAPALRDGVYVTPRISELGGRLRGWWQNRASQGQDLGRAETVINIILAVVLFAGAALAYPAVRKIENQKIADYLPVAATDFIIEHDVTGRMLNMYRFGGYLIHRLYPEQKVFIDGRADMYGDAFIQDYMQIYLGGPGWAESFDSYDIDYVLCDPTAAIRQLLLLRGDFRVVFEDTTSTLLVRDIPRFSALPDVQPSQ